MSPKIGLSDVLLALDRYEEISSFKCESRDHKGILSDNVLQVFRWDKNHEGGKDEIIVSEAYQEIKGMVDETLLYGTKSLVELPFRMESLGSNKVSIQTTQGLASFINDRGFEISVPPMYTFASFFDMICDYLVMLKCPLQYLMLLERNDDKDCEYNKVQSVLKNLGSCGVISENIFDDLQYRGFKFLICPLDNAKEGDSFLIPLSKIQLQDGSFVDMFSARYTKPLKPSNRSKTFNEFDVNDRTEFLTTQCLHIAGARYFFNLKSCTQIKK